MGCADADPVLRRFGPKKAIARAAKNEKELIKFLKLIEPLITARRSFYDM